MLVFSPDAVRFRVGTEAAGLVFNQIPGSRKLDAVRKLLGDLVAVGKDMGDLTAGEPLAQGQHQKQGEKDGEGEGIGHAAVRKWSFGGIIWHRTPIISSGWTWK